MITKELKYVIVDDKGCDTPILFPLWMNHDRFKHMKPSSAGMVRIGDETASAYGKSVGLELKSKPTDSQLITYTIRSISARY